MRPGKLRRRAVSPTRRAGRSLAPVQLEIAVLRLACALGIAQARKVALGKGILSVVATRRDGSSQSVVATRRDGSVTGSGAQPPLRSRTRTSTRAKPEWFSSPPSVRGFTVPSLARGRPPSSGFSCVPTGYTASLSSLLVFRSISAAARTSVRHRRRALAVRSPYLATPFLDVHHRVVVGCGCDSAIRCVSGSRLPIFRWMATLNTLHHEQPAQSAIQGCPATMQHGNPSRVKMRVPVPLVNLVTPLELN
jgi:hypothetical protein